MKEQSNIKKIADSFLKDSNISEEQLKFRRDICGSCEYNSSNKKDLSIIEKARLKLHPNKPFCTACTCFIKEKTKMGENECGLSEIGKIPKWNKLILKTNSEGGLVLINNSPKDINLKFSNKFKTYELDFGEIQGYFSKNVNLNITNYSDKSFELQMMSPSCGACTTVGYTKDSDRLFNCNIKLSMSVKGMFKKKIYVTYKLGAKKINTEIILKGKVN